MRFLNQIIYRKFVYHKLILDLQIEIHNLQTYRYYIDLKKVLLL